LAKAVRVAVELTGLCDAAEELLLNSSANDQATATTIEIIAPVMTSIAVTNRLRSMSGAKTKVASPRLAGLVEFSRTASL
jgi:hypothetical protein